MICGFSPDFFKRKTLTHHYPLCVVCLFYHCPGPGGVPLFANVETRFTGFGGSGEGSVLRHHTCSLLGAEPEPGARSERMFWGGERKRATLPAWWSLGFFSFVLGFCFIFFSISFIFWHNEACLSQCYAMD